MKVDKNFHEIFGIKTKIEYLSDVVIEEKYKKDFLKKWKKFYKKGKDGLSKTRKKQIEAFYKKFNKEKTDISFCDKIEIRFISKQMGHGVFAKEDIPKYTILNHYAGILRPDKVVADDNDSSFGFPDFKGYSIDAQDQGNWARFMNHSENTNVVVWEYYLSIGPRIFFTSGPNGIKKGEQLTYSYGDIYWDEEDNVL